MPEQGTKKFSVYSLILANILVVVMAIVGHWPLANVLWVYWCQSVIIGIFQVVRMLNYRPQTPGEITVDPKCGWSPSKTNRFGKIFITLFFVFHYGLFHVVYFIFLAGIFASPLKVFPIIWPAILIFVVNHFISLLSDPNEKKASLSDLFTAPYKRIFPMHLILFFGVFLSSFTGLGDPTKEIIGIIFFSGLKTVADVFGHNLKHNYY